MAPLGHPGPYLLSTGMSQLGGPRICLLTPSASQTCLPDCFGEPGGSLERVPERGPRRHLLMLAARVPLCAWVLLEEAQCQLRLPAPLSKGDRCLLALRYTGLLLPG